MSVVRFFQPDNRLARAVTTPGGKRVHEAVADAEAAAAALQPAFLEAADALLARIAAAADHPPTADTLPGLYADMRELVGAAGGAGLPELSDAALAVCGLLDAALQGLRVDQRRLQRCSEVLFALRRSSVLGAEERAQIAAAMTDAVRALTAC